MQVYTHQCDTEGPVGQKYCIYNMHIHLTRPAIYLPKGMVIAQMLRSTTKGACFQGLFGICNETVVANMN